MVRPHGNRHSRFPRVHILTRTHALDIRAGYTVQPVHSNMFQVIHSYSPRLSKTHPSYLFFVQSSGRITLLSFNQQLHSLFKTQTKGGWMILNGNGCLDPFSPYNVRSYRPFVLHISFRSLTYNLCSVYRLISSLNVGTRVAESMNETSLGKVAWLVRQPSCLPTLHAQRLVLQQLVPFSRRDKQCSDASS